MYVHWNPELVNWSLWIYRSFIMYMCRTFIYINIRTRLITDWQYDDFHLVHLPHRNLCSSEQPNNKVLKRGRDDCVVVQVNKWLSTMTTTLHNLIYEQRVCIDNPWIMSGHKHSISLITLFSVRLMSLNAHYQIHYLCDIHSVSKIMGLESSVPHSVDHNEWPILIHVLVLIVKK